jgi:hypothetical protein
MYPEIRTPSFLERLAVAATTGRDKRTAERRAEAGIVSAKVVVQPDLAAAVRAAYPSMPFATAILAAAARGVGLEIQPEALQRRGGRPRKTKPETVIEQPVIAEPVVEVPVLAAVMPAVAENSRTEFLEAIAEVVESEPAPATSSSSPSALITSTVEAVVEALNNSHTGFWPATSDLVVFRACKALLDAGTRIQDIKAEAVAAALGREADRRLRMLVNEFKRKRGNPRGLLPRPVDAAAGWTEADLRLILEPVQRVDADERKAGNQNQRCVSCWQRESTPDGWVFSALIDAKDARAALLKKAGFVEEKMPSASRRKRRRRSDGTRHWVTRDPAAAASVRDLLHARAIRHLERILRRLPPHEPDGLTSDDVVIALRGTPERPVWTVPVAGSGALDLLDKGWQWDATADRLWTDDPDVAAAGAKRAMTSAAAANVLAVHESLTAVGERNWHRPVVWGDEDPLPGLRASVYAIVMPTVGPDGRRRTLTAHQAHGHGVWREESVHAVTWQGQDWLLVRSPGWPLRLVVDEGDPLHLRLDRLATGTIAVMDEAEVEARVRQDNPQRDPQPSPETDDGTAPKPGEPGSPWQRWVTIGSHSVRSEDGQVRGSYPEMLSIEAADGKGKWSRIEPWTDTDGRKHVNLSGSLFRIADKHVTVHLYWRRGWLRILDAEDAERIARLEKPVDAAFDK